MRRGPGRASGRGARWSWSTGPTSRTSNRQRPRSAHQPERGGGLPPVAGDRRSTCASPRCGTSSPAALDITAVDYLDAQRQRLLLAERAVAHFARCDLLASPTTPVVAPPRADYERYLLRLSRNTIVWSLAGCPAVSLPCGTAAGGLPVGLQLAARPGGEGTLVEAGLLLEAGLARR